MNPLTSQITGFVHSVVPLPAQAWIPVRILSTFHWCWRWNYKKKIYADPDNWIMLAAGNIANMCIGSESWIRTVAHIILIVHRTKLYVQQVYILIESSKEFYSAIKGRYSLVPHIDWTSKDSAFKILTQNRAKSSLRRAQIIKVTFFRMMTQLYSVAMHAVEIYDAFYRRHEALNEVLLNTNACLSDLQKSNTSLSKYLKENKPIIENLLKHYEMSAIANVINLLQK